MKNDLVTRHWDDFFLGFDGFFKSVNSHYPPTDVWVDNNKTYVQLALAGFKKDELKVEIQDNALIISGSTKKEERKYHTHGISKQGFTRNYVLNEGSEVESADFQDGLLTIIIKSNPPGKNLKQIEIK